MKRFFYIIFLSFFCINSIHLSAQTFPGTTGVISDDPNPTETVFTAVVSGLSGNLTAAHGLARICLNITHPQTADLQVYLVAPNGARRALILNKAGTAFTNTCFTMTDTAAIKNAKNPHTGSFLPEQGFACWNNIAISGNGIWRLVIANAHPTYSWPGNLNSWSITFGPAVGISCGNNPAAADICGGATEICTLDGYCGSTTSCYAPDKTGSNIDSLFEAACTNVDIHNNSWLTFVASAASVDLALDVTNCTNGNEGIQLFVTSTTDCKKFVGNYGCYRKILGKDTVQATGLTVGKKYYVMIDGAFGDVCDYKITAVSGVKTVSAAASKPVICPGESTTLSASAAGTSANITYTWAASPGGTIGMGPSLTVNPTTSTTYTVSITDCNTILVATTQITVNPVPDSSVFAGSTTICSGNSTTLTASAPLGNSYKWYNAPTGGTLIQTGATYATPVLTSTTTYYVEATSSAGCTNTSKTPVTVTVNITPPSPVITGPASICSGNKTVLTATAPGGTYKWYDAATGGNILYTGTSYTTDILNNTITYYVEVESGANCISTARTPVTVSVNTTPVLPLVTGPTTICSGNKATLTATSPGGVYKWYDAATGGNILYIGNAFTTDILTGTVTYYVAVESAAGCTSVGRTPVTVTVFTTPLSPAVTGPTTICSGNTSTLTATSAGGGIFKWYDTASGNTPIFTGPVYTTPVLTSSKTYYVEVESAAACTSVNKTAVTVTVHTTPLSPVVTLPDSICKNTSAVLTATAPGGTYKWYDAATGGNLLHTGPAYTTPLLTSNQTYYVEVMSIAGCTSVLRTPVTVKVSQIRALFTASPIQGPAPLKVDFTNTSSGATSYQWDFGDNSDNSSATNPSHIYSRKGEGGVFEVKLTATNSFGCNDEFTMTIIVDPFSKLVVPNVFTPNKDGVNDEFKVESIGLNFVKAELFSRWGLKMYEWSTVHEGWDGRTTSGVEAPAGTYYYMIVAKGVDGREYEFKGHFTLLR